MPRKPSVQDQMLCGAFAGVMSRMCIAPLDVIKIRLQIQVEPTWSGASRGGYYCGIFRSLWTIFRDEGVIGLWRGNVPGCLHYLMYCGIQFAMHAQVQAFLLQSPLSNDGREYGTLLGMSASAIGGGVAGVTATVLTYPFDFVRTVWIAQCVPSVHSTLPQLLSHTYAQHGVVGFYRGLTPTLLQAVPQAAAQFSSYGLLKDVKLFDTSYKTVDAAATGLVAGLWAKLAVQPLDVMRKRIQANGLVRHERYGASFKYDGIRDCAKVMYQAEGIFGFYKGLLPALLKMGPSSAITFAAYERAMSLVVQIY